MKGTFRKVETFWKKLGELTDVDFDEETPLYKEVSEMLYLAKTFEYINEPIVSEVKSKPHLRLVKK